MVGLGVGIDYSLLIVTRFREELNRGLSPLDAAVRTIQTAGSAVVTSGVTVVVGFAALILTRSEERRVGKECHLCWRKRLSTQIGMAARRRSRFNLNICF